MSGKRTDRLKTIDNPERDRDYAVTHETVEFTFLYPLTDQPCFASVEVVYGPDAHCLEMMSLKQYLNTFRDETHYFEAVTNQLLDDLLDIICPKHMTVTARFTVRGGISSVVKVNAP